MSRLPEPAAARGRQTVLALALVLGGPFCLGNAQASPELSTKAGCAACHAVDKAGIGPSWRDVAARYRGKAEAPAALAAKVRQGSKGTWGQLPMLPTDASKISDADLKTVIAWVLKTPAK